MSSGRRSAARQGRRVRGHQAVVRLLDLLWRPGRGIPAWLAALTEEGGSG
jgi:hypothetical protein